MLNVRRPDQTGDTILAAVDEMTAEGRAAAVRAIELHMRSEMKNSRSQVAPPVYGVPKDGGMTRLLNVDRANCTVNDDLSLFTEVIAQPTIVAG